ncbi:hypothetical protein P5F04_16390, partial [Clostridium perfringens]|nr:hypothetical protein [Clostridium perfringens]
AEMVIRGDGKRLDAGVDEELCENGLEFGLTRLQIITTDEGLLALGEFDDTGDEGVLRGAIDEWLALQDGSNGEEGRRGDLSMGRLNGSE